MYYFLLNRTNAAYKWDTYFTTDIKNDQIIYILG